jgi:hypothetical protein
MEVVEILKRLTCLLQQCFAIERTPARDGRQDNRCLKDLDVLLEDGVKMYPQETQLWNYRVSLGS